MNAAYSTVIGILALAVMGKRGSSAISDQSDRARVAPYRLIFSTTVDFNMSGHPRDYRDKIALVQYCMKPVLGNHEITDPEEINKIKQAIGLKFDSLQNLYWSIPLRQKRLTNRKTYTVKLSLIVEVTSEDEILIAEKLIKGGMLFHTHSHPSGASELWNKNYRQSSELAKVWLEYIDPKVCKGDPENTKNLDRAIESWGIYGPLRCTLPSPTGNSHPRLQMRRK